MTHRTATAPIAVSLALAALLAGCTDSTEDPGAPVVGPWGSVQFLDGQPAAGATVRMTGVPNRTVRDDGTFSLDGVPATYDAMVVYGRLAIVYVGLTAREPKLTLDARLFTLQSTTVSGTVSGLTAGNGSIVGLATSDGGEYAFPADGTGAYTMTTKWHGANPATATLHLLEFTKGAGTLPSAFVGHASALTSIAAGVPTTQNLAKAAVTSQPLAATSDVAADLLSLWVSWPEGGVAKVGWGSPGTTTVDLAAAEVAGATWAVLAEVGTGTNPKGSAWRRGIVAGASPAAMTIPTPAAITAPADLATGVGYGTDFTWTGLAGGVHVITFFSGGSTNPRTTVVTAGTTARIPDLTEFGYPLPPATVYWVSVEGVGPYASMDEAVAAWPGALGAHPGNWDVGSVNRIPDFDGYASYSSRSFTTP